LTSAVSDITILKPLFKNKFKNFLVRGRVFAFVLMVMMMSVGVNVIAQCPTTITVNPVSQADCYGNTVLFDVTISALNPPTTYTWQRKRPLDPSFTDIVGDPNVSYPTASSMLVSNIGVGSNNINQTQYQVVITDVCGTIISLPATLLVNDITTITPSILTPSITSVEICQGTTITYTAATQGQTPIVSYIWRKNGSNLLNGGVYSGVTTNTLTITNPTATESGDYSVTVVFPITQPNNNPGNPSSCQQTSSLVRNLTVLAACTADAGLDQTVCASAPNVTLAGIVGGGATSGTWSGGGGTFNPNANTLNAVYTPSAAEILAGIVTLTLTTNDPLGPCTPVSDQMVITINPTPTVVDPADQIRCNGAATAAVTFTGTVTGTTFNWTNNTPSIGLAASGSGNIASFNAVNIGTTPVVATITVTPTANGCPGTPQTFTITVNPTPTVADPADQIVCNGTPTAAVTFTGAVAGTTFNWTNNTPSIGLAASGSGNIASFNAVNIGTTPVVATITVTPTANGCPGTPQTFTITVNPTPTVNDPADQVVCNGSPTTAVNFSGTSATSYTWTNSNTSIGLAASGYWQHCCFHSNKYWFNCCYCNHYCNTSIYRWKCFPVMDQRKLLLLLLIQTRQQQMQDLIKLVHQLAD
jgi:hypothetical protein